MEFLTHSPYRLWKGQAQERSNINTYGFRHLILSSSMRIVRVAEMEEYRSKELLFVMGQWHSVQVSIGSKNSGKSRIASLPIPQRVSAISKLHLVLNAPCAGFLPACQSIENEPDRIVGEFQQSAEKATYTVQNLHSEQYTS